MLKQDFFFVKASNSLIKTWRPHLYSIEIAPPKIRTDWPGFMSQVAQFRNSGTHVSIVNRNPAVTFGFSCLLKEHISPKCIVPHITVSSQPFSLIEEELKQYQHQGKDKITALPLYKFKTPTQHIPVLRSPALLLRLLELKE